MVELIWFCHVRCVFTLIQSRLGAFRPRGQLLLKNLALRQQLTVLTRNARRPRFSNPDTLDFPTKDLVWLEGRGGKAKRLKTEKLKAES